MRTSGGPVGPRGATLLLVAAVAGSLLAVHGWSTRHAGPPLGALSGAGSSPGGASGSPVPSSPASPSGHGGSTSASRAGGASGRSAAAGPLLSSESFASYSYQVWPGTPSA